MYKLNTKYIYHTEGIINRDNIYDDSIDWRLDTSCDWCHLGKTCPYSNIDRLNEKRSCFVAMSDSQISGYKIYLLRNNVISLNNLNCFYIGRCYERQIIK